MILSRAYWRAMMLYDYHSGYHENLNRLGVVFGEEYLLESLLLSDLSYPIVTWDFLKIIEDSLWASSECAARVLSNGEARHCTTI